MVIWHFSRNASLRSLNSAYFQEREAEFQRYVKEKVATCKSDFRQLLKEIKCVSHKSKEMLRGANGDSHMREIRQFLTVSSCPLIVLSPYSLVPL